MKKRVLSTLLALCMVLTLLPGTARAATNSGTCGDNLTWTLEDGVLTVSGEGAMENYIGPAAPWYEQRSSITKVILEEEVTSVGDSAFTGCGSLISVIMPDGLIQIGRNAFEGCTSLTSANIPASVQEIGNYAFYDCGKLINVTIPSGVTTIKNRTFSGCKSITAIDIPSTVTCIEDFAFAGSGLENVHIPASVTDIGRGAFGLEILLAEGKSYVAWCCRNLKNIYVDSDNAAYTSRDGVLFSKDGSVLLQYPQGGSNDYYSIPEDVEKIGAAAFAHCGSLASITVPEGVKVIERDAFLGCDGLKDIYYSGSEDDWNAVEKTYSEFEEDDALKHATVHYGSTNPSPDPDPNPAPNPDPIPDPIPGYPETPFWPSPSTPTTPTRPETSTRPTPPR